MFFFLLLTLIDVSTNAQEVTCEGEQLINVDILTGHPGIVSPYKPGHILVFRCTDENLKMHGHRVIECQPDGKWDQPYPTCREPRNVGGLELLGVLFWRLPSSEETGHCNSSRCREKPLSAQYPKTVCTWFILRINPDGTKCLNHKIKITDQPGIWKKDAEKNRQPESPCDIFHQRAC